MATIRINGLDLYYEMAGSGEPLMLVHGSWGDHNNWAGVVPLLSQSFRVCSFDRRGHSQSERPPGQGNVGEDVSDLAALIEELAIAPAHVVGNSFGATIALRLAGERPDLFRSLVAHEPPLLSTLEGDPQFAPMLAGFNQRAEAVIELLRAGEMEPAARLFVETIAFRPGAWETLPQPIRDTFVVNGPTWLDETNDPASLAIDLGALARLDKPALVTTGTESPPFFAPIAELVARALPRSSSHVFAGAGHVPHISHPLKYVETVRQFCE
ncbi:MAG: alpha/beta fold hydrolase [Dehalococcoidia bacterium]